MAQPPIRIGTADPGSRCVEVRVEQDTSAASVYIRACDRLGLLDSSRSHFSLFQVTDKFEREIKPTESVLGLQGRLAIKKTTVDAAAEKKLMNDDAAIDLLFDQAYMDVESMKIIPTDKELEKLDEFSNPAFTAKRQYVELCQTMPSYRSIKFEDCVCEFRGGDTTKFVQDRVQAGVVQLLLTTTGIDICNLNSQIVTFPWVRIRKWTLPEQENPADGTESMFNFEFVPLTKPEAPFWVHLRTRQGEYLLACVRKVVEMLAKGQKAPEWPELRNPSSSTKSSEGFMTIVNKLFGTTKGKETFADW